MIVYRINFVMLTLIYMLQRLYPECAKKDNYINEYNTTFDAIFYFQFDMFVLLGIINVEKYV